jgi:two-component system, NtrC family, sensor kinase
MKNIQLIQQAENGLTVFMNRRQLEEVFFNLIINACHAMEKEGGMLKLNAYRPNKKVIVEIADTGVGIPKENKTRVFDPFYSTKGDQGSGLGLYITKQLIERNGGKISVKSKHGEGTKFTLTLPAK